MTKVKKFILLFLILSILIIAPNILYATSESYSDTNQGIEWSYELNNSGNIINL